VILSVNQRRRNVQCRVKKRNRDAIAGEITLVGNTGDATGKLQEEEEEFHVISGTGRCTIPFIACE
jgi:hypothetical protein